MNPHNRMNHEVSIERMTRSEVDVALKWAQIEGWNPGIHDAECFYHADPDGFYAAKLDGEIVGTISIVKYSKDFAFEGLYIVKPEFRGRGIGLKLQNFALNVCKDSNLGLDGVVAMQQKYELDGFRFAHNNTRYAGIAKREQSNQCVPIQRQNFGEIASFDLECFAADRTRFLDCWLLQNDAARMLTRDEVTGKISGYGAIRKCVQGHKIGPLFANDGKTAELLFKSLASTVPGETVFLDVPQPNTGAVELATKKHMQPVFSTVRMYTNTAPNVQLNKIYGITTFELG